MITITAQRRLFPLGSIYLTQGAAEVFRTRQVPLIGDILSRHVSGDWGDLDADDKALNDAAVRDGGRILSAYSLADDIRVWVITEWDRSATTVLLPSEY